MLDKPKIILILIILAIGVAFLSIMWVSLFRPSPKKTPPTPIQTAQPQPSAATRPTVNYQSDKLLEIVKTRPTLSTNDSQIKAKLITSLNNQSGILNQTNTYILEYVKTPNVFQIEILVTDFDKAKTDAVDWLESKGFSFEGICKLPVMFYLSKDVANQLRDQNIKFDPLPEGCS